MRQDPVQLKGSASERASVTRWPDDAHCRTAHHRALAALRAEFPRLRSEHADLIQDAAIYIATWEKHPRDYPYELTQVALRRAVDLARKQNRRAEPTDPQSEALEGAPASAGIGVGGKSITPEEELIRTEHCQLVRRVCGKLGEDEARALKLRFLDGRTIPEVMSELGLARQSVYRRLEKACIGLANLLPNEICPDQQSRTWAKLALRHRMGLCDEEEEADYRRLRSDERFVDVDTLSERTARGVGAVAPFIALSKASVGPLGFVSRRLAHFFAGGGKGGGATAALTAKNVAIVGAVIGVAAGGSYLAGKATSHSPAHASRHKVALVSAPANCGIETLNGIASEIRIEAGSGTCVEARKVFAALPGAFSAAARTNPSSGQAGTSVLGWRCVPGGPGIFPVVRGQTCMKSAVTIAAIGDSKHPAGAGTAGRPSSSGVQAQTPTSQSATRETQSQRTLALKVFEMPSKNILCSIDPSYGAWCDIKDRGWSAGPQPPNCQVTWVEARVAVDGSGTRYPCDGAIAVSNPGTPTLQYGWVSQLGSYQCTSSKHGVRCQDLQSGRGFDLSREVVNFFR